MELAKHLQKRATVQMLQPVTHWDKLNLLPAKQSECPLLCIAADVSVYEDCKILLKKTLQRFGEIDAILIKQRRNFYAGRIERCGCLYFKKLIEINYLGNGVMYCKLA
jgi:NAD(P)-dependent dehydrogenase (short-subunit alcohol dehydrogenase family)